MYEIFAYGNNDSLYGIFNAMAAIMGGNTYLSALAAVAVAGFFSACIAYAFAPEKLIGWKWLASVIIVYSVLLVPKVTVGIIDKLGNQPVQVIGNVPFGAAVFGHVTSVLGNGLTEVFETAFQAIPGPGELSADLTYQRHGLMFGNRLVRETRGLVFSDPEFRTDIINFIANCTMFDLADGTINPATFSRSTDLWALMGNPNPARFSTVTSNGFVDSRPCPDVYRNLAGRLPQQVTDMTHVLAILVNPNLPVATAQQEVANQVWAAYLKANLAGAASNAAALIRQNALINAVNDTSGIIGQRVNDPSSQILAVGRAQATAQINASWINFGRMAQEALPLIRNSLEGIIYALFPFVILLLFFTHGQGTILALKSYLVALVWIQLWPPIYAILNYFGTLASAKSMAAAASMGTSSGMALATASPIYQNGISAEAVVGYLLMVALPSLAWAVLKGVDTIGQTSITGIGSLQGAIAGATGSAAAGNLALGNASMDQLALAPTRTSPYARKWQDDLSNNVFGENFLSGKKTVSLAQNEGYVSIANSSSRNSGVEERVSKSIEAARSDAVAAAQERSAVLAESVTKGRERLDTKQLGSGYTSSEASAMQETYGDVRSMVHSFAKSTNKDEATAAQLLFNAAANVGLGKSGGSAAKGEKGAKPGLNAGGSLNQQYTSGLSRKYDEATQTMTADQAAQLNEYARRFQSDQQFRTAVIGSNREAEDISSRLQNAVSRSHRAEAALRALESFAEDARFGEAKEDRASVDVLRDPSNWRRLLNAAETYGSSPSAYRALVDGMIAESSVLGRPTKNLQGSELLWSRSNVGQRHEHDVHDDELSPNIKLNFSAMKARVGARPTQSISDSIANEVQEGIQDTRNRASAEFGQLSQEMTEAAQKFGSVTGIVATDPAIGGNGVGNPDGVLRSKRILSNDAVDLFWEDTKQSIDNLGAGLKELTSAPNGSANEDKKK